MAIAPLPPVVGEIQQYTGQPGRTIPKPPVPDGLLALQSEPQAPVAVSILPTATALDKAISEALGRQDGMAQLFATLTKVADTPSLPPPLKSAVDAVLAFRLGQDGPPTGDSLRRSVSLSGLFHENQPAAPDLKAALAGLRQQATAFAGTASAPLASGAAPSADFRPVSQRLLTEIDRLLAKPLPPDALTETGIELDARTLFARAAQTATTPEPIRAALTQLLAPATPASPDLPSALGALRTLLTAAPTAPDPAATAPPTLLGQRLVDEIDRVLVRPETLGTAPTSPGTSPLLPLLDRVATIAGLPDGLKQAITNLMRAAGAPLAGAAPLPADALLASLTELRREVVAWASGNADRLIAGAATPTALRPLPPRKGAPLRGQGALPPDASPPDLRQLVSRLVEESDRSLSRLFLHQALLADSQTSDKPASAPPQQSFLFELPIAGPTGTSIAQFRFERDGRRSDADDDQAGPAYRAEIAFDIAPLGPMTVRVGLLPGKRIAIGLWCENVEELHRLEAERDGLIATLEAEGFTVSGIDLHRGRPTERTDPAAPPHRHRLDVQL
ncbi:flagellar hook-length control protein FliK [Oryzibacter oryziterrae]|uniref:flagellar hook-length control protein FliK n=1 Tax=Oryzibacter oryziterrae TaxID=2766474 RepID=UPI001F403DAB|nr:flagellar hook-length control protein FliK [Oryzibacter oryziterrae]